MEFRKFELQFFYFYLKSSFQEREKIDECIEYVFIEPNIQLNYISKILSFNRINFFRNETVFDF
jgi:hypothetical protein